MVESPSSSEVCGQYVEHLLYSPSHSQTATISFTYGRIVSSLFKGTALFLSVTTLMCPIKTSQNGLESDPLHLIFCYTFPTCNSMEMQEVEKKELPEESKDKHVLMPSILQEISVTSLTVMTNLHLMNQKWAFVWMELVVAPKLKKLKFQPVSQVASVFVVPTICID